MLGIVITLALAALGWVLVVAPLDVVVPTCPLITLIVVLIVDVIRTSGESGLLEGMALIGSSP